MGQEPATTPIIERKYLKPRGFAFVLHRGPHRVKPKAPLGLFRLVLLHYRQALETLGTRKTKAGSLKLWLALPLEKTRRTQYVLALTSSCHGFPQRGAKHR